jgi:hypothetical protein
MWQSKTFFTAFIINFEIIWVIAIFNEFYKILYLLNKACFVIYFKFESLEIDKISRCLTYKIFELELKIMRCCTNMRLNISFYHYMIVLRNESLLNRFVRNVPLWVIRVEIIFFHQLCQVVLCFKTQISRRTIFVAKIIKANRPLRLAIEILKHFLIELLHILYYFNIHRIVVIFLKPWIQIESIDKLNLLKLSISYSFFLVYSFLYIFDNKRPKFFSQFKYYLVGYLSW